MHCKGNASARRARCATGPKASSGSAGGPRAGSGAAVAAAMRAAGMGWTAWASGRGLRQRDAPASAGGAPVSMHSGQSMWLAPSSCAPSSVCTTILTAPALEQTSSIACGCTIGEATATPSDSTNHSSTRRPRWWAWRRQDMRRQLSASPRAQGPGTTAVTRKPRAASSAGRPCGPDHVQRADRAEHALALRMQARDAVGQPGVAVVEQALERAPVGRGAHAIAPLHVAVEPGPVVARPGLRQLARQGTGACPTRVRRGPGRSARPPPPRSRRRASSAGPPRFRARRRACRGPAPGRRGRPRCRSRRTAPRSAPRASTAS